MTKLNVSVSLTTELRLEQALSEAGIENPATVIKLTVNGMLVNKDFMFIRKNMAKTLQELDLGNASVRNNKIPKNAFSRLPGVTIITLPDSIDSFQIWTFAVFENLISINVRPDNPFFISVDGVLFNKDKTALVLFPAGRKGNYVIPDSISKIGEYAFYSCSGLTSVNLPESVVSIGRQAFRSTGLTSINIPKAVVEIGEENFPGCFITVHPDNPAFTSEDGILFNKAKTKLISFPKGYHYAIPDTVIEIGENAFADCTGLSSITIPDSVIKIDDLAFWGCKGLTSVTIPDSVIVIGDYAFAGCYDLTSVMIPYSVVQIKHNSLPYKCITQVHPDNPFYTSKNGELKRKM